MIFLKELDFLLSLSYFINVLCVVKILHQLRSITQKKKKFINLVPFLNLVSLIDSFLLINYRKEAILVVEYFEYHLSMPLCRFLWEPISDMIPLCNIVFQAIFLFVLLNEFKVLLLPWKTCKWYLPLCSEVNGIDG